MLNQPPTTNLAAILWIIYNKDKCKEFLSETAGLDNVARWVIVYEVGAKLETIDGDTFRPLSYRGMADVVKEVLDGLETYGLDGVEA